MRTWPLVCLIASNLLAGPGGLRTPVVAQSKPLPASAELALPPLFDSGDGRLEDLSAARQRWIRLLEKHVYGRHPGGRYELHVDPVVRPGNGEVFSGKANRHQFQVRISTGRGEQTVRLLLYLPAEAEGPVPVFLGLNFYGNQTVDEDPGIEFPTSWIRNNESFGIRGNRATEDSRGVRSSGWPVQKIVERGYGLATAYYGDLDPDYDDGFRNGIHPLFDSSDVPPEERWGSIAGWAWGLRRLADVLVTIPGVDSERLIVVGHSRLGKTALWAGAQDPRFAITISNNSGCGGAALSRRKVGESVARINEVFPHWFCPRFHTYGARVAALPVDQHFLIAACAPRPVYVASASEDTWADPVGEFLSLREAAEAFARAGRDVTGLEIYPENDRRVGRTLGYHVRTGEHDLTEFDWDQFMDFADHHLARR